MAKQTVRTKKDTSQHVEQKDKIAKDLTIKLKYELTEKQKEFISLVQNKETKIVLCKGPAGSAKSFLSVYTALLALNERRIGQICYLRNPVESSSYNIGFLPGTNFDKVEPYLMPLRDKLNEFLPPTQVAGLEQDGHIKGDTIGFLRGASLNASFVCLDECQNFSEHDFLLTMTRIGKFSKFVYTGDVRQSDTGSKAFEKIYNLFDNDEAKRNGIMTFKFGREDIVREKVISYILDKFEEMDEAELREKEERKRKVSEKKKEPEYYVPKLSNSVEEHWRPGVEIKFKD
jgi:phosphate starvation-inducible protein PhoH and related proteins